MKSQSSILERPHNSKFEPDYSGLPTAFRQETPQTPAPILSRATSSPATYQELSTATHIRLDRRGQWLAPELCHDLFRKAFGTTMTAIHRAASSIDAQRLLVTTDDTILHVAIESVIKAYRFNEAFKKRVECSPRDYRKSHR